MDIWLYSQIWVCDTWIGLPTCTLRPSMSMSAWALRWSQPADGIRQQRLSGVVSYSSIAT